MKRVIHTEKAPKAIGPYSQAIGIDRLVFTSGQLPLDTATMEITAGGIKAQSHKSLENLQHVLEQAGATLDTVVKTTCYLSDMENFAAFNEVYAQFFGDKGAPARSCFEVARLPRDVLVEVEAIAFKQ